jgi:hypothetical protein
LVSSYYALLVAFTDSEPVSALFGMERAYAKKPVQQNGNMVMA